ncbi:uncharacterized protein LOC106804342 [Setaria italica]|uniref:uncharacterized protein LOC106804342 n=1 Tax=Setaria italica TaxID=4555 RepID=UPI000719A035|nr:uncharacterized protein LOC106804342 [Setaria italica]
MAAYCNKVHKIEDKFDRLELNHVARHFNKVADELAKTASGRKPIPDGVFISDQYMPSIRYKEPGRVGDAPPAPDSGADPGEVGNAPPVPDSGANLGKVGDSPSSLDPEADPSNPEVMEIDANLVEGPDPMPDWRAPYLNYLIREMLQMNKTEALQTVPITWPFAVWGLDLVEPFKKAPGGLTLLLVAVDKFSKWIEARPVAQIKSKKAVQFFIDIIHHFGVPNSIITDNGTQFTRNKFLKFCDNHHIQADWSAVVHHRTNG